MEKHLFLTFNEITDANYLYHINIIIHVLSDINFDLPSGNVLVRIKGIFKLHAVKKVLKNFRKFITQERQMRPLNLGRLLSLF